MEKRGCENTHKRIMYLHYVNLAMHWIVFPGITLWKIVIFAHKYEENMLILDYRKKCSGEHSK